MKINNEQTIYGIHMVKLVSAVLILLIFTLLITTALDDFILRTTGLSQTWVVLIFIALYIVLLLYFRLRNTAYFAYNDDSDKILIKSYRVGIGTSKKVAFEIPKKTFHKYTISKKHLGEELTIYIRTGTKISKYPPVSISSVTHANRDKLIKALDSYSEV